MLLLMAVALSPWLAGCDRAGTPRAGFPTDEAIAEALRRDFEQDPDSQRARELVRLLGGEKGRLDYAVHEVIQRAGGFEARYDVRLRMGRDGADSLRALYQGMVPKDELAKLPDDTAASLEKWLEAHAATLERTQPPAAAQLRASLATLRECYQNAKADQPVPLMQGLSALLAPERQGWHADKLDSPRVSLKCLPL